MKKENKTIKEKCICGWLPNQHNLADTLQHLWDYSCEEYEAPKYIIEAIKKTLNKFELLYIPNSFEEMPEPVDNPKKLFLDILKENCIKKEIELNKLYEQERKENN